METKRMSIDKLTLDREIQCREKLDDETIKSYAQDIEAGAKFPAITVFHDDEIFRVADGFHRVRAHQKLENNQISVEIHEGGKREAILHSVGANADHGLRRTNADKRKAVELLLTDPEWEKWSDREIAKKCGVAPNTVGAHRDRLSAQNAQIEKPEVRTVKRGSTTYKQKTEKIGKTKFSPEAPPERIFHNPETPNGDTGFCVSEALRNLRKIEKTDPYWAQALQKVRDWIDRKLADFEVPESEETEGFALAIPAPQSDESEPRLNTTRLTERGSDA